MDHEASQKNIVEMDATGLSDLPACAQETQFPPEVDANLAPEFIRIVAGAPEPVTSDNGIG
jgi:hypothetical protein